MTYTREAISEATGFDSGDEFTSQAQVARYFSVAEQQAMFGGDGITDQALLDAMAAAVIEHRWHMAPTAYEAYRYAADGHAGEPGDDAVIATGTLEECRSAIRCRILPMQVGIGSGLLTDHEAETLRRARWDGTGDDVEAYHESDQEGCGGWAIRPARP